MMAVRVVDTDILPADTPPAGVTCQFQKFPNRYLGLNLCSTSLHKVRSASPGNDCFRRHLSLSTLVRQLRPLF
jgi:hypothetical protein